jgi:flagellar L-ring protein precursor FlgH
MKRIVLTAALCSVGLWARGEDRVPPSPDGNAPPPASTAPPAGSAAPGALAPPGAIMPGPVPPPGFAGPPFGGSPGFAGPPAAPLPGGGALPPGMAPPPGDPDFFLPRPPLLVRDFAWAYIDVPKPREIKLHDIVTVIVKEASESNATSRYNRQRNGNLTAQMREFIRIGQGGRLLTAASNQPSIDTNLQGRLQSTGQVSEQEGIKYRIASTVVDVLPNGILVLEARKTIHNNLDLWEYTLTGRLRPQDIAPDNTALSEHIADLQISKKQKGKLTDSTQRPWGLFLYDKLAPF